MKRIFHNAPISPLLFPVYSVLVLWLVNIDQIPPSAVITSLVNAIIFGAGIFILSWLVIRKQPKTSLVSFIIVFLSLIYGHTYIYLKGYKIFDLMIGRHLILIPVFGLITLILVFVIMRSKKDFSNLNQILNIVVIFMTMITLGRIGIYLLEQNTQKPQNIVQESGGSGLSATSGRDVYYIVLDSYGRQDWLADAYHYDNSLFVDALKRMGFVFPACTQANYTTTELSLTSSLNMSYLEDLGIHLDTIGPKEKAWKVYRDLQHNQIREIFKEMGYQFITFKGVYPLINITDSDIYYDLEKTTAIKDRTEALNFRYNWLTTTIATVPMGLYISSPEAFNHLPPWLLRLINPLANILKTRYVQQYEQNLYSLDRLEHIVEVPGRKFVYAHLYVTHQPFVFTKAGDMAWPINEDADTYRDQVIFANQRIPDILQTIIEKSEKPPIIILQGDHNYSSGKDRVKILNAYYLPDGGDKKIYAEITPVNTFRVILNQYFNGNYPLLPDISYFAPKNHPYQFTVIPPTCVK